MSMQCMAPYNCCPAILFRGHRRLHRRLLCRLAVVFFSAWHAMKDQKQYYYCAVHGAWYMLACIYCIISHASMNAPMQVLLFPSLSLSSLKWFVLASSGTRKGYASCMRGNDKLSFACILVVVGFNVWVNVEAAGRDERERERSRETTTADDHLMCSCHYFHCIDGSIILMCYLTVPWLLRVLHHSWFVDLRHEG